MKMILKSLEEEVELPEIDHDAIVSVYEGHTILSIFIESPQIFKHILDQCMKIFDEEEENEEDAE